ncbi:hypothetical protein [Leeuwenhoekiella blandensis]|uniref:Uncharacterized protein n=1 Tax=Leeuwenhoekiella blandensis (strain CECT 7118 / CCUG 51940 / KCTC 22103 / MED217) TaxID=398720 RepID=A3XJ50_LEEBM|nr:hypothetical protein [Leeuwenhoekiella blandensis]EAQ50422.1 hypothetical protein MED217_05302 [Leeuwenhoekiella blandensis MED217]
MNLIYQGKNPLVDSAVRRTTQVLKSSFFQNQLLQNLTEEEAQQIQELFSHIHNSQEEVLLIKTYWNPLVRTQISFSNSSQCLEINLATLRKSRRILLEQIVRNYTLIEFRKIHPEWVEFSQRDEYLASKISSLAKVYA